jgi:hypothetical protein
VTDHKNRSEGLSTLTADKDGIQIGTYSTLTGERIDSGALIPSGKKWNVNEVMNEFMTLFLGFWNAFLPIFVPSILIIPVLNGIACKHVAMMHLKDLKASE